MRRQIRLPHTHLTQKGRKQVNFEPKDGIDCRSKQETFFRLLDIPLSPAPLSLPPSLFFVFVLLLIGWSRGVLQASPRPHSSTYRLTDLLHPTWQRFLLPFELCDVTFVTCYLRLFYIHCINILSAISPFSIPEEDLFETSFPSFPLALLFPFTSLPTY